MRIQHNIMAMNAYRNYTNNVSAMKQNLEKLSSGYKINRAGDDAAGLAISEKMRAQITGLETAQKNAKDGISLVQTAEGALTEVHDMLNRMVELATQSANGTYDNTTDRAQMQKEVDQLLSEINRIADSSNFNGIKLLDGTLGLNTSAFELASVDAAEAGEVSGFVTSMTAPSTTANAVTKLHTQSTSAVVGDFTVYLGQAAVDAPASGTASIKVTIGGTTLTVKASAAKTALTASKIATNLIDASKGKGGFFYVKADGTKGFAASEAAAITAAGKKGLVYAGAVDSNNNVKYTLSKYVTEANGTGAAATVGALTSANVGSKAFIDLNMDVKIAAGSKGACTYNAANVGTNAKNSVMKKDGQMGSAEFVVDLSKLKEGMEIEIDGTKKKVTFDKNNTTADINLSAFVKTDGTLDTAQKGKIMDKIATAFKGQVTGIDVGVNGAGNLTLSEQKNAASTVYKKMESEASFKSLVKLQQGEVKAGSTIKVKDANSINEGDVLNIGDKKIVFTKKSSNTGDEYINISGKSAEDIAKLIQGKIGSAAKVTGDKVTVEGMKALGRGLTLQIGDTSDDFNQINVKVQNMHAADLGIGGLDISSEVTAQAAIQKIKDAINTVSDVRGTLGATQNRLDHTINNLSVMTENIQDAESTIRDTDVAEEMMAYTKNNILIQSAQAMLAQANQVPQGVLQLLG